MIILWFPQPSPPQEAHSCHCDTAGAFSVGLAIKRISIVGVDKTFHYFSWHLSKQSLSMFLIISNLSLPLTPCETRCNGIAIKDEKGPKLCLINPSVSAFCSFFKCVFLAALKRAHRNRNTKSENFSHKKCGILTAVKGTRGQIKIEIQNKTILDTKNVVYWPQ